MSRRPRAAIFDLGISAISLCLFLVSRNCFSLNSNLLLILLRSHRIVQAFREGNHLQLEVSCVTFMFSGHDGKKAMGIKVAQRLKRNRSKQRARVDSNWTGKNVLVSLLIGLPELKLSSFLFYFLANLLVLSNSIG